MALGHEPTQLIPADRLAQMQAHIAAGARQQHLVNPLRLQLRVCATGHLGVRASAHPIPPSSPGYGQRALASFRRQAALVGPFLCPKYAGMTEKAIVTSQYRS